MIIRRGTTEPNAGWRFFPGAITAIILLVVVSYAFRSSVAAGRLSQVRPVALLAIDDPDAMSKIRTLSPAAIRTALAGSPLDQSLVNVAMVANASPTRRKHTAAWLRVLGRLGWRDTPSLQNMMYAAASAGDLSRLLNLSDGLLRRQELIDQIVPVLVLVEADPGLRSRLVSRLASRPNWRGTFLAATSALKSRAQLLARFDTIRALERRRVRLAPSEVTPAIIALDQGGLPRQGFALWQNIHRDTRQPLDDPDFTYASRNYVVGLAPVPYQWQMMAGDGFSADAARDGPRAALEIDWDGRGVPVFAQQRTSGRPGRYALDLAVPTQDKSELAALSFRLVCDGRPVLFAPVGKDPARLRTTAPVPCAFSLLQIAGDVQPSATVYQVMIDHIDLRPLDTVSAGSH